MEYGNHSVDSMINIRNARRRGAHPLLGARPGAGGERGRDMPTYVVLYKFTDAGAKNIKATVQQATENRAENERRGFQIHGLYWTQGQYDLVAVVEAPDEQAMLAGLFNIASAGNVRSETLRAFTQAEMEAIIQKM
jgi:uncharacterized protein with GYD domain